MLPYAPWLCWAIPVVAGVITPLVGRIRRRLSSFLAVLSIGTGAFFSFSMIPEVLAGKVMDLKILWLYPELGVLVDPLNVLMACVIACIGFLVTVFSVAYMREEPSLARFWFLIQLFIGGYLIIVLADNLLFMFMGWEIVGLCCTGLAAFWHQDPEKAGIGLKTFMVLRVADVLLLASILVIYTYSSPQTLNILELAENSNLINELARSGMLFVTAFMFFGGAIGKAAQFPLQEWLPDALAASPSSFSALTECLAGPFIIARVFPIFHQGIAYSEMVSFFLVVASVGAFTVVISALIAMVQDNIFKVLSYAISSVIGYMMAAFGLAGLTADVSSGFLAGTFLLTIDAFITALLFLSATYIAYTVGSSNLHHMSGFGSKLAHRSLEVGALALGGIPPLSGFWCTNWIQSVAWEFAVEAGGQKQFWLMVSGYLIFALLIVGAGITAFYGLRMMGLVFGKDNPISGWKVIRNPPSLMRNALTATLVVTAFLDFLALLLIWPFNRFLLPMPKVESTFNNVVEVIKYIVPSPSTIWTCVAVVVGGYPAYKIYVAHKVDAGRLMEEYPSIKRVHKILRNRFYINTFYYEVAHSAQFLSERIHDSFEYGIDTFNRLVAHSIQVLSQSINDILEHGLNVVNGSVASRFLSLAKMTHKYVETEGIARPQIRGFSKFYDALSNGIVSISRWAYPHLELGGFEAFNYEFAKLVTFLSKKIRRTHTGVLSYNMVTIPIGIILLVILLMRFGGIL